MFEVGHVCEFGGSQDGAAGLLFCLLACVVEGVQFDTWCLLDFLRHWCPYGISQTSVSATAGLRGGKGTHAKR